MANQDQRRLDLLDVTRGRHRIEALLHRLRKVPQGQLSCVSIEQREQGVYRATLCAELRQVAVADGRTIRAESFRLPWSENVGHGAHEHVARKRIYGPRLDGSIVRARATRDVPGEGPHRGVRRERADERDAIADGRMGRSQKRERSAHTGPE